eukprot:SAG11_NODE_28443_length_321_cov_1.378378_1_plen_28_part_10
MRCGRRLREFANNMRFGAAVRMQSLLNI